MRYICVNILKIWFIIYGQSEAPPHTLPALYFLWILRRELRIEESLQYAPHVISGGSNAIPKHYFIDGDVISFRTDYYLILREVFLGDKFWYLCAFCDESLDRKIISLSHIQVASWPLRSWIIDISECRRSRLHTVKNSNIWFGAVWVFVDDWWPPTRMPAALTW